MHFTPADYLALLLFAVVWVGYERFQRVLVRRHDGINHVLLVVRRAWMREAGRLPRCAKNMCMIVYFFRTHYASIFSPDAVMIITIPENA